MTSCPVDDADEDARLVDVVGGQVAFAYICYFGDCGVVAQLQGPGAGREIVFDPEAGKAERIKESCSAVKGPGKEVAGGKNVNLYIGFQLCACAVAAVNRDTGTERFGLIVIAADPELRAAFIREGNRTTCDDTSGNFIGRPMFHTCIVNRIAGGGRE